jgi:hypothetical protein
MMIAKARPSVAGQAGHNALYAVACALVVGFDLPDADAWDLICEYNVHAQPAWSDKDLRRKLDQARKHAERHPLERGALANENKAGFTGPVSSTPNKPNPAPTAAKASVGQPKQGETQRTPRTHLFSVSKAGGGRSSATPRTLRTLTATSFSSSTLPPPSPIVIESKKEVSEVSGLKAHQSAPVQPSPLTKAPLTPKPKYVAPERVDTTVIWADGSVAKKPWGKPERFWNLNDDPRKK